MAPGPNPAPPPAPGGEAPATAPREGSPTFLERAGSAAAELGGGDPARSRRRTALQVVLVALVFGFLAAFLVTQWGKLPDFDWRFRPGWLALGAAAIGLFYVVQAETWRFILARLGSRIGGRPGRAAWGKSLVARYVPTNALMVVGRVVLAERHGVPRRVCLASMAYEVGISVCAAVLLGSYFAVTLPALEGQPARYAIFAVVPLALAALHPRVFRAVGDRVLDKLGRESLPLALPFRTVLALTLVYLSSWTLMGTGLFAFASALHPVGAEDAPFVIASYSVGYCVAVLTFVVPSGLGTRDATIASALAAVLPGTVATAIAVAFRLFQTAIELLYVAAVTGLARRRLAADARG